MLEYPVRFPIPGPLLRAVGSWYLRPVFEGSWLETSRNDPGRWKIFGYHLFSLYHFRVQNKFPEQMCRCPKFLLDIATLRPRRSEVVTASSKWLVLRNAHSSWETQPFSEICEVAFHLAWVGRGLRWMQRPPHVLFVGKCAIVLQDEVGFSLCLQRIARIRRGILFM